MVASISGCFGCDVSEFFSAVDDSTGQSSGTFNYFRFDDIEHEASVNAHYISLLEKYLTMSLSVDSEVPSD